MKKKRRLKMKTEMEMVVWGSFDLADAVLVGIGVPRLCRAP
jgi:hypothetical protein